MRNFLGGLLLVALLFSSSSSISKFSGESGIPDIVPGELLVRVKSAPGDMAIQAMQQLFATTGVTILKSYSLVPGLYHLKTTPGREFSVIKNLENNSDVLYAEPNYIYHTTLYKRGYLPSDGDPVSDVPNDKFFSNLWGLHNTGQTIERQVGIEDADIDALEAWNAGHVGSDSVVVAIIDTGFDYTHPDIAANAWENTGETGTYEDPKTGTIMDRATDKIDNDENGFIDDVHGWDFVNDDGDPMDDHGHGTHVSGTIGAAGNDENGVVGVNWHVKIMGLKFLSSGGSGTTADAVSSIEYATKMGAKVYNNSWGGGGFTQSLFDAIKASHDAGALFVAAAGNSGSNNDSYPHYPSSYDVDGVLAVSATDNNDVLASWSSYGRNSVDVAAPGVNIYSTIPDESYAFFSGTSMATPHVSGLAALIWASEPELTNLEVKERIMKSSEELRALLRRVQTGSRVNADYALKSFFPPKSGNFTPAPPWEAEDFSAETPHNYPSNYSKEWKITKEGALGIRVHFADIQTEAGYDFVTITDAKGDRYDRFDGVVGEIWAFEVPGDTAIISFVSDGSVNAWGFKVDKFAYRTE